MTLNELLHNIGKPFKEELLMPLRSSRLSMEQDEPAAVQFDTIDKIQDIVTKVCYNVVTRKRDQLIFILEVCSNLFRL